MTLGLFVRSISNFACALIIGGAAAFAQSHGPTPIVGEAYRRTWPQPPAAFMSNDGQWNESALFISQRGPMTVRLERDGLRLRLREGGDEDAGRVLVARLAFEGADPEAVVVGEDRLGGVYHFFLSADSSRWRTDVPAFGRVRYQSLYQGIDLVVHGASNLRYDLMLRPGAPVERIVVRCEGIAGLELAHDGSLLMATTLGPVHQTAPVSWEVLPDGTTRTLASRFRLLDATSYGFEVPERCIERPLVIDPGLEWSTLLGGSGGEGINAVSVGPGGEVTVGGSTSSPDFPVTPGVFDATIVVADPNGFNITDAFVARFSPSGTFVFSTFLGGNISSEVCRGLEADREGIVTIVGLTGSSDFPTTPGAFDRDNALGVDVFITRLNASGSALIFSTYLGNDGSEEPRAMALGPDGSVFVVGATLGTADYPVTPGAFDTTPAGTLTPYNGDAFLTRLSADGMQLIYSTLLGGVLSDTAYSVDVDAVGAAVVAGLTSSTDFPVTPGVFSTTKLTNFVTRVDPTGSRLEFSTFFGSPSGFERVYDLQLDAAGDITLVGLTANDEFPVTPGAYDVTFGGAFDGYVTRMAADGTRLLWSTFLGGGHIDEAFALDLDSAGRPTVAGYTSSTSFPVTPGASDVTNVGDKDVFVSRLSADGADLLYSTYLGGASDDGEWWDFMDVGVGPEGEAVVAGATTSADFPTTAGALDTNHVATSAFVTALDMLPTGAQKFGASSPGCQGAVAIGVTSMPSVGNPDFALTALGARPNTTGLLVVAAGGLHQPDVVVGVQFWLDRSSLIVVLPTTANDLGYAELPVAIPDEAALVGARAYVQSFWLDGCGLGGWAASNALALVVQP